MLKLKSQQNTHAAIQWLHQTIERGQVFAPEFAFEDQHGSTIQFLDPHLIRSRQIKAGQWVTLVVATVAGAFSGHADTLHH